MLKLGGTRKKKKKIESLVIFRVDPEITVAFALIYIYAEVTFCDSHVTSVNGFQRAAAYALKSSTKTARRLCKPQDRVINTSFR